MAIEQFNFRTDKAVLERASTNSSMQAGPWLNIWIPILGELEDFAREQAAAAGIAPHNVNTARQEKRAVLPSEIGLLADMEGYLKLSGNYPVCKIKYEYVRRDKVCEGYIPRDDLVLAPAGSKAEEGESAKAMVVGQEIEQTGQNVAQSPAAELHATTVIEHETQDGAPTQRTPGKAPGSRASRLMR